MRKITGLIFTILLVMGLYCTVSADDSVALSLSDASATAGDEISVDLSISGNTGLYGLTTLVIFDSSVITPVSFKTNSSSDITFTTSLDDAEADKNIVYTVTLNGTAKKIKSTYNGVLGTLKFKVKDNAPTDKFSIDFISDETIALSSTGDELNVEFENSTLDITSKVTTSKEAQVALILKDVSGARKLTDSEKADFGITGEPTVFDAIGKLKNN
jgi:hypothetical protein